LQLSLDIAAVADSTSELTYTYWWCSA